jgi:hypothetical protein
LSIVFALERTNQLSLLPDKDLVDLCPPIEPYQVTKNPIFYKKITQNKPLVGELTRMLEEYRQHAE